MPESHSKAAHQSIIIPMKSRENKVNTKSVNHRDGACDQKSYKALLLLIDSLSNRVGDRALKPVHIV